MKYDEIIVTLADYVHAPPVFTQEAYHTAALSLADALGCAVLALKFPQCTKLLGPVVPETIVPHGSRIPGTQYVLDPILAAFDIGSMIRWLDYNDTWLAAEWAHPSDNLGGILAVADYLGQTSNPKITVHDILRAMIQAYEIQGGLALENSFNRVGLDHVIFVKVATAAVVAKMLGASHQQLLDVISNAWIDLGPLRTYRHAPNTGSRKSWAAGDATSRGVQLAYMIMRGEMGYPTPLSTKKWGLYDVLFHGKPFVFQRPLDCYVMENILFKVSFPAEFHAQTAVESAIKLHPHVKDRLEEIACIDIETHESALRIIDKVGVLRNPADRDHCLQYMVAIGLLHGTLTAHHYEDHEASNPKIDVLRNKMTLKENKQYSIDYMDPDKRSIANSITIRLHSGETLGPIETQYPLGHRKRRQESLGSLFDKLDANLRSHFSEKQSEKIVAMFRDYEKLKDMSVTTFVGLFCD